MRVASSQPHLTDIEVKCILRRRKILSASLLGEWNIMKHTANRGDSRSNVEQRYETLERPWWTTLLLMYCGISIQRRVKYGLLIGLDAIYWAKLSKGPCLMTRLFSQKNNMSLLKSMSNTCEHARFVNVTAWKLVQSVKKQVWTCLKPVLPGPHTSFTNSTHVQTCKAYSEPNRKFGNCP